MSSVTQNPPLASYYMAAASTIVGWNEIPMHIVFLLPAIGVLMGTYRLARKFCGRPGEAALIAMAMPVFFLSSTTVMSDMLMLCFWVWAVILWMEGLSSGSWSMLLLSSIAIVFAALTKYFGISLIPLLLAYSIIKQGRATRILLVLLVPCGVLTSYQWMTAALYGRGLLFNAVSYATSFGAIGSSGLLSKIAAGVIFTGGCCFTLAFYSGRLWGLKAVAKGMVGIVPIVILLAIANSIGGFSFHDAAGMRWGTLVQAGLFATVGLAIIALAISRAGKDRTAESILLSLWIGGTLLFAIAINWTVNGRSLLPMVPALAILLTQAVERRDPAPRTLVRRLLPLFPAAALALLITYADCRLANCARDAASEIATRFANRSATIWFEGHWGFQYYMERLGGKAIDVQGSSLSPGDHVAIPFNNTSLYQLPENSVPQTGSIQRSPFPFLSTMNFLVGAGFYADVWGPLPFVIGKIPPEKYLLYTVSAPLEIR